jgi:uncharacterized membrane protein YfcA
MTLVASLALMIGLLLGSLGGGGSILAVPLLVYVQHVEAKTAIAMALVMVGATSLIAMVGHARRGMVCWKTGLVFAMAGSCGAYGGGRLAAYIPNGVLLLMFGTVMLGTSWAMLRKRPESAAVRSTSQSVCPARMAVAAILLDGVLVGGITGLVGAGGGFLIVPALNLLGGLPMRAAVGTSLMVLTLNSTAALGGYITHVNLDWPLTGLITAAAVIGSLLGGLLSHRLSPQSLKRVFGAFVMLIALYVLYREMTPDLIKEVQNLAMTHADFLWGMATAFAMAWAYRLFTWAHARAARRRDDGPPVGKVRSQDSSFAAGTRKPEPRDGEAYTAL